MRAHFSIVAGGASVLLVLFVACTTDYQKGLDDPNFGAPNALAGQEQPGPSSELTSDGGGGGGGGGGAGAPACVSAGGTLVDGGPCSVSFKTTILAEFNTASCQTAGSCHGGATPPNQPKIDVNDGPGTWAEFASFKLSNGKLYINPCSTDPTQSTISCNVNTTGTCGTLMPLGVGLPASMIADIDTWLKCGAPNN